MRCAFHEIAIMNRTKERQRMTLDEAIKHSEEKAKELYSTCELWERLAKERNLIVPSDYEPCKACAEEHEQLAEWLKDYKRLLAETQKGEWIPDYPNHIRKE